MVVDVGVGVRNAEWKLFVPDLDGSGFCGWGSPGHDVSRCLLTAYSFILAEQMGQATRPSSKLRLVLGSSEGLS